jgi:hypothetical protein
MWGRLIYSGSRSVRPTFDRVIVNVDVTIGVMYVLFTYSPYIYFNTLTVSQLDRSRRSVVIMRRSRTSANCPPWGNHSFNNSDCLSEVSKWRLTSQIIVGKDPDLSKSSYRMLGRWYLTRMVSRHRLLFVASIWLWPQLNMFYSGPFLCNPQCSHSSENFGCQTRAGWPIPYICVFDHTAAVQGL